MKVILTLNLLFFWGFLSSVNAQIQNRSAYLPGVQQIIMQHGDELNLTEQQKTDLIALQIERRSEFQRPGIRGNGSRGQMTGQRRDNNRRGNVRDNRRDGSQGLFRAERSMQVNRSERMIEHQEAIREILTDQQISQLQSIRLERIEQQHEFRSLRNRTIVTNAEIDENKVDEVIAKLNQISEHQKNMQIQRLENEGEVDAEEMQQNMDEIRTIHEDLRNLLTVSEYQSLRPGLMAGQRQQGSQRSSARFMQRRQ
ncbi:MAG: Spy/CpxP family protein refolding chaperone [Balneolaceae bacterium]